MRKLLIVESPAKIKTIGKFLGKDFKIMSTFGHVKDLPSKKIGVEITDKNDIVIDYVPLEDKAKTISDICKQARSCSEIYLASDPDREGEIISWHIGQEIEKVIKKDAQMHRISFNEITKPAVEAAIQNKREINIDRVHAQQARRVLDRWVGYQVSPILWKKITKGLSAGRVQSVALLLICNREKAIEAFKPEEYWSIHALYAVGSEEMHAELAKIKGKKPKIDSKEKADAVLADMKQQSFSVSKIEEKKRLKNPVAPFMTSSLQQDAFNKLGFSVDRTMRIAQKLYEGLPLQDSSSPEALITYMRTDSVRISDTALKDARAFIKSEYGSEYLPAKSKQYGSKGATQDAHEAIRPITASLTPEKVAPYLKPEQAKLYALIWKRFMASQMKPAEYFQRSVHITGGDYEVRASGSTLMFDGFLKVYKVEDDDEKKSVKIPKGVTQDLALPLKKIDGKQHFTKPPARYSQATLVKEMKKEDIGRPSTYAATLSTLEKRKYVTVENKRFVPSMLGKSVTEMLVDNLPDVINIKFTAQMEQSLDKIAEGKTDRNNVLLAFWKPFSKDLEKFAGSEIRKEAKKSGLSCPTCKKDLLIRFGKAGEFLGCEAYPECKFTSNFKKEEDGSLTLIEQEKPVDTPAGMKCPKCKREMVNKVGRYGPFISCSGYPECKHIHQETMKMPCPKCGGAIGKRNWRGGEFWGCKAYPKCKFAIFGKVEETPCTKCKNTKYVLITQSKDGSTTRTCPDKDACGHKETSAA